MSARDATVIGPQTQKKGPRFCPTCRTEFDTGTRCPFDGAALEERAGSVDPFAGRVLDARYRIERRIGEGASAVVFLARDLKNDRDVAIKLLRPTQDADLVARFRREAQVVSRLSSPNNVEIVGFGQHGDTPYIAMEYLQGKGLDALLAEEGALDATRTALVLREVCRALEEAHALGMIHRDLKPANIFLARAHEREHGHERGREVVKVLDFGIAKIAAPQASGAAAMGLFFAQKLTAMGAVMGTPIYMSPEQARDQELDGRSDLYALGVVAYHCLAGHPPFEGAPGQVIFEHTSKLPPPLVVKSSGSKGGSAIDPALTDLVMKMLEKDPADRPASATELRVALDRMLTGQAIAARRETSASGRAVRIGLASLLAIAIGLAVWLFVGPRAPARGPTKPSAVPAGYFDVPLED